MKLNKKRVVAGITKLITDQTLAIAEREAGIGSARALSEDTSELPEYDHTILTDIPTLASRYWSRRSVVLPSAFLGAVLRGCATPPSRLDAQCDKRELPSPNSMR
jgi:hypothetical protein